MAAAGAAAVRTQPTPPPVALWVEQLEAWKQKAVKLGKQETRHQWEIATWMLEGEMLAEQAGPKTKHETSKVYDIAETATGLDRQTLKDWAYTVRNVASSLRNDALSFYHHKLVAKLGPIEQEIYLKQAAEEKLSVAALRAAINAKGSKLITPKVDRVLSFFAEDVKKKLERAAKAAKKTPTQFVHDVVVEYLATCK